MVAHLFGRRALPQQLGTQFGAAITYFLVLALVPAWLRSPSGLRAHRASSDLIETRRAFSEASEHLTRRSRKDSSSRTRHSGRLAGVGIMPADRDLHRAGWMGNMKNEVRAQWRPTSTAGGARNFVVKTAATGYTARPSAIAITLAGPDLDGAGRQSPRLGGLTEIAGATPVLRTVPVVSQSVPGGCCHVTVHGPARPGRPGRWSAAALCGSHRSRAAAVLHRTRLNLSQQRTASIFGPVIVMMLFFTSRPAILLSPV